MPPCRLLILFACAAAVSAGQNMRVPAKLDSVAPAAKMPSVLLRNAALEGVWMQAVGLGTGAYTNDTEGYSSTLMWLKQGGRRIDASVDYFSADGVGRAIVDSGVPRRELFITSKIQPKGYGLGLKDFDKILAQMQTDYIDLLLIHWPSPPKGSPCMDGQTNGTFCRVETWRALESLFAQKVVRAIGVSNYEQNHIDEIINLGRSIPSVNQCEFHIYWNEPNLVRWGQARNITFNSYAPLGSRDRMLGRWTVQPLQHPIVGEIAKTHSKTPAQVMLRWAWQLGIVLNPRSYNARHQADNMDIFNFSLSGDEMYQLLTIGAPRPPQEAKVCPDPHTII